MSIPRLLSAAGAVLLVAVLTAAVFATPPNVKVNSDVTSYLQNEEQIWISPFDANLVIADWRDWRLGYRRVGVGVSTDGGATWSDSLLTDTPYARHSDPCLVGDLQGRFYLNVLNYEGDTGGGQSLIVVYRSDDNGVSWSGPVSLSAEGPNHFEDKQFTAVDRTGGAHSGNYYCSWTRFPNPTRIMFVRSTDGAQSFDDTVTVGPSLYIAEYDDYFDAGQFSIPIVDADGDVHVFWQGYEPQEPYYSGIRHVYSTDGGQTFSQPSTAFYNNMTYWDADGGIDIYGMPNGDCDISGGPYNGTIYISQCQLADPDNSDETDVTVRKSTDKGETWTDRQVVNDDPPGQNKDQFHPWLYVNDDGVVLLIFYDQRDDPNHYLFNSYFAASFDGGETYIHNMRISDTSINPTFAKGTVNGAPLKEKLAPDGRPIEGIRNWEPRAGLFAEYIGIHSNHDTVSTIWTDTRNGNQDAYSARFLIPFMQPRLYLPTDQSVTDDATPDFRWSTCWHETEDSYRLEIDNNSDFSSIDYSFPSLADNNYTPTTDLATGDWYWRVKAFRTDGDSTGFSETFSLTIVPKAQCGDANGDLLVNITDATFLVQYIFAAGPAPDPLSTGDANCDGSVNITDAVYIVAYIFGGGPVPCANCP